MPQDMSNHSMAALLDYTGYMLKTDDSYTLHTYKCTVFEQSIRKASYRHTFWIFNPDATSFSSPLFYNNDKQTNETVRT